MSSVWRGRSGCQLEPAAKGLEVNELWLRALVSNESWQWRLNRVTHNTTKLTWLWMEGGKTTVRRRTAAWPKPSCAKHVTFVRVSQTAQEQVRLSYESVWALFDVLVVKTLTQSCSDGDRQVDTAAVHSLLVINECPRTELKWCSDNMQNNIS